MPDVNELGIFFCNGHVDKGDFIVGVAFAVGLDVVGEDICLFRGLRKFILYCGGAASGNVIYKSQRLVVSVAVRFWGNEAGVIMGCMWAVRSKPFRSWYVWVSGSDSQDRKLRVNSLYWYHWGVSLWVR